jgi:hypothetical protein
MGGGRGLEPVGEQACASTLSISKRSRRLPCQCNAASLAFVCDGVAGNEAPVDLYVNSSGLMWENAESFGAYLIWAEHR